VGPVREPLLLDDRDQPQVGVSGAPRLPRVARVLAEVVEGDGEPVRREFADGPDRAVQPFPGDEPVDDAFAERHGSDQVAQPGAACGGEKERVRHGEPPARGTPRTLEAPAARPYSQMPLQAARFFIRTYEGPRWTSRRSPNTWRPSSGRPPPWRTATSTWSPTPPTTTPSTPSGWSRSCIAVRPRRSGPVSNATASHAPPVPSGSLPTLP